MAKKKNTDPAQEAAESVETPETTEVEASETPETTETPAPQAETPQEDWEAKYQAEHDSYLRLAAEFDNFRKRTIKEKDASYGNGKADAVAKLLPVYDNLERALNQPTEDAAYKKGVEMTMTELVKIFTGLGVEIFGNPGDEFDPNLHNAVMHVDDEQYGESEITEVFQRGYRRGDKVIRDAMVKVAN